MCSQKSKTPRAPPGYTAAPPANWAQADFDDSGWGRYGADLLESVGGYGYGQSAATTLLCLRTRFGIADPAQAKDLTLALEYRGGVVVYVNGQELARQHLPKGQLEPHTSADDCPPEAFTDAAGAQLPAADRPAEENRERYEQRIRKITVTVPPPALRKGSNVLAIELHATPIGRMPVASGKTACSTAGLCDVKLSSQSGAGVVAYSDALKAVTLANATPLDTISVQPTVRKGMTRSGISYVSLALTRGNPFDPLQPVRTLAPRGGTASGQVVVSGPGPMSGLQAAMGSLRHAQGNAVIPSQSVQVRYGRQPNGDDACAALHPQPLDGAPVQPVWVLVDVPRDQPPGWYTGALTITVSAQTTQVPVQVLVAGWTLTDPKDNATFVSLYQSPDTLAEYFKVEPWSDRHFALIEKSMDSMAKIGNDVLFVPVILDNYLHHKTGLIRWVRKGNGYEPEFSAFERHLDLQTKVWGRPKVVTLSIWKHDFGCRTWFRGMNSDVVKPCLVTELDPATGKMTPLQAPHFGAPGSEEFWKTMIEGARKIVRARGLDDQFLLLGEVFDSRPLEPVVKFFQKIEPGMRWHLYAHLDSGDQATAKDGKMIVNGGFEIGLRIRPNEGALPEFRLRNPKRPEGSAYEFYLAQARRCAYSATSSPLSYRVLLPSQGVLARVGLDFWPLFTVNNRPARSLYSSPPNEGWLYKDHVPALTAAGPDGAVITTRGQMLLEGVQEAEVRVVLVRAMQKTGTAPEVVTRIERCLAERQQADLVGDGLSQAMISLDFGGMAAREYALAAELAGEASEGDWQHPPSASPQGGGK